jgi:hypothetical protein
MSRKLQLSARMKIREGKLDGFKRQAAICISEVKEKDPGILQYDWFLPITIVTNLPNLSFQFLYSILRLSSSSPFCRIITFRVIVSAVSFHTKQSTPDN